MSAKPKCRPPPSSSVHLPIMPCSACRIPWRFINRLLHQCLEMSDSPQRSSFYTLVRQRIKLCGCEQRAAGWIQGNVQREDRGIFGRQPIPFHLQHTVIKSHGWRLRKDDKITPLPSPSPGGVQDDSPPAGTVV